MKILRTGILLILLSVLLVVAGDALAGPTGMKIALAFAIVMNAVSYFFSDKIALKTSGAQPVTREQLPRLYAVMERLAAKANLPVPKLYVIPEEAPNAFATGRNPRHASVAATIAGAITYLAHMAQWGMIFGGYGGERDDDREGGGGAFAAIAMMILAPFAALMLQLFLSRTREYSADETGARMVGQPYGLISALQKLGAYNQRIPTTALAPTTAALCIVKPLIGGGGLASLFSTHPPLEDRIAALRQMTIVPQR
jgi:heat shock protein HtpX